MDEFLTTKQVAARIGKSEGWVRKLLIDGDMAGTKHGRAWLVHADEVDRYIMIHGAPEPETEPMEEANE